MPVPGTLNQIVHSSLRDDVYVAVREGIVSGGYRPGQVLREGEIEAATGASRTPVREALGRLVQDGFVVILPQRETRVAALDVAVVADALVVFREVLERSLPAAVQALAGVEIPALRTYAQAAAAGGGGEAAAVVRGDLFDGVLVGVLLEGAGNRTVTQLGRAIALHTRWLVNVFPDLAQSLVLGPERVVALREACWAGDVVGARAVLDGWWAGVLGVLTSRARPRGNEVPRRTGPQRALLRDQVFEVLLDALTTGTLASGERLREDQLMAWLGVSRTPLREALGRLEMIGLIEVLPRRLTRVAPITRDRAVEVASTLSVCAALGIRLGVPRLCVEDLAMIRAARVDAGAACEVGDLGVGIGALVRVLEVAVAAAENQPLTTIVRSLDPWLYRCVDLFPNPDIAGVHLEFDELAAALLEGDVPTAVKCFGALMGRIITPSSTA